MSGEKRAQALWAGRPQGRAAPGGTWELVGPSGGGEHLESRCQVSEQWGQGGRLQVAEEGARKGSKGVWSVALPVGTAAKPTVGEEARGPCALARAALCPADSASTLCLRLGKLVHRQLGLPLWGRVPRLRADAGLLPVKIPTAPHPTLSSEPGLP